MKSRLPDKKAIFTAMRCVLISCIIVALSAARSPAQVPQSPDPMVRLLPLESELKGWKLDGDPETAEGMALFELINGGAEEYVKEGFRRAVLATYINKEGRRINVEIYEMLSPENARAIHRKKTADKGTQVPLGDEAVAEDYYVNFRKGAYQVTLSGYDTRKETLEWVLQMARLVDDRIAASPGTP